jgi:hypothetical protein
MAYRERNPFYDWSIQFHRLGVTVCPKDGLVPLIKKHFKIDFSNLSFVDDLIKQTFLAFWDVSKFEQHGLKRVSDKIIQGKNKISITRTVHPLPELTIHEIDGWLSLDHLNSIFVRSFTSTPGVHNKNPFVAAFKRANALNAEEGTAFSIPDFTILPALYERFGVKSFEELELSEGEMESLAGFCKGTKYNDIWETTDSDGKVVRALEVVSPVRQGGNTLMILTDAPLSAFMRKLESLLENHKNPVGFKGGADVFQQIADGTIRGKKLGRLCIADKEMLRRCETDNYRVFRIALKREFGIEWEPHLYGYKNARDLYGRMHSGYFYYIPGARGAVRIFEGGPPPKGAVVVIPNATDPQTDQYPPNQDGSFWYNPARPEFSFFLRYVDGHLFGAGTLLEALGGSAERFIDEMEEMASTRHGHGAYTSPTLEAAFPDEGISNFQLLTAVTRG